jgi:N-acetylglucosaminyl-diphospho-decaprenol L-rhamnosyltransferase
MRRLLGRLWPNSSGLTSDYSTTHSAPILDGGCIIMRRNTLQAVGLLDEKLMQGPDDYDFCYRVSRAGFEIWYVAESEIIHRTHEKESVSRLSPTYLRTALPQTSYLYSKYHGRVRTAIYCFSAYLLALKWRRMVERLYGKDSVHMQAVVDGATFSLSPARYEREYRELWARPAEGL